MCAPGRRPKRGRRGPGRLHAGSDPAEGGLDESQVKGVGDGAPCVLVAWA